MIYVKYKKLHEDAVAPKYAKSGDAGFDLVAVEDVVVGPGETVKVRTGLAVDLPEGYELQIRPRSGVTLNTKLRVQLGTVDAGYRGEIGVIVDNTRELATNHTVDRVTHYVNIDGTHTDTPSHPREDKWLGNYNELKRVRRGTYIIRKGDRIAQAVVNQLPRVQLLESAKLSESTRGDGGFGSTGIKTEEGDE